MPDRENYPSFDEISLHILDIAMNSIAAHAALISIDVEENESSTSFSVCDDGDGMPPEILKKAALPHFSTKKSAGLGLFILKKAAENAGGSFSIFSKDKQNFPDSHGTLTRASFDRSLPLGDLPATVAAIITAAPSCELVVNYSSPPRRVRVDTREMRRYLGNIPIDSPDVIDWVREQFAP